MAALETLPADQRAVLQLVLARGRSYDDIASMLSIDRAAVRERALSALDALGPQSELESQRRALITDYLLGQLPSRVSDDVHDRLGRSPGERAWARVVAAELAPLASSPLPEIPAGRASARTVTGAARSSGVSVSTTPSAEQTAAETPAARRRRRSAAESARTGAAESRETHEPADGSAARARADATEAGSDNVAAGERPTSRLGGAILLGALLAIIAVVAVLVLVLGDSGSSSSSSSNASATASTTGSTSPASTGRPVAQVNLSSPTGDRKIGGVAIVIKQGNALGIVLRGQGIPANGRHDAYAVWLSNSPSDSRIVGFVSTPVKANGVLQTVGPLPAGAQRYKQLLVTLETQGHPRTPGQIVLQGAVSLTG